jgi:hypothetical protein
MCPLKVKIEIIYLFLLSAALTIILLISQSIIIIIYIATKQMAHKVERVNLYDVL